MGVRFTADVEKERAEKQKQRNTWELLETFSLVEAVRYARDHGWAEKKVQVRREGEVFYVEPFEKDCSCPNILKYKDYFDGGWE